MSDVSNNNVPAKQETAQVPQKSIDIEKLKKYLAELPFSNEFSENQVMMFIEIARHTGLNPFLNQIFAIPYKDKETGKVRMSIVTKYDQYIRKAEESGLIEWWKVEEFGDLKTGDYGVVVKIKRKDRGEVFEWKVYYNEVKVERNPMWITRPHFMTMKTAIAQAFRICFPSAFEGYPYIEEEIQISSNDTETIINIAEKKEEKKETEIQYDYSQIEKILAENENTITEDDKKLIRLGIEKKKDPEKILEYIKTQYPVIFEEKKENSNPEQNPEPEQNIKTEIPPENKIENMTQAQNKKIHMFKKILENQGKLQTYYDILRTKFNVFSSKELNKDQASAFIKMLEEELLEKYLFHCFLFLVNEH
jgi:phage recombination protein Bet